MVERLFLDGVDGDGDYLAVGQGVEGAVDVFSNPTEAGFSFRDDTLVRTEMAVDHLVAKFLVE